MSKSQAVATDLAALFRARNPLLWIVTREEQRVKGYVVEAARVAGYLTRWWDVAAGVRDMTGARVSGVDAVGDPDAVLDAIGVMSRREWGADEKGERYVWVLCDLPDPWLAGAGSAITRRRLRNLAMALPGTAKKSAQTVVVMSPSADVPPELANHATVIEWPLPDRDEIGGLLDAVVSRLPDDMRDSAAPNGTRDAAIDAAVGLSGEEAQACYARSLVSSRRIDPVLVAAEKKRVIARERVIEWFDPLPGGLDAVGGLDNLKTWLVSRAAAYSPAARAYGLPAPKGALLVGVPGCGKSLTAKAIATAWGVPLLRLDLGALKSKFVGESEGNLRKALSVIEALGRCVVWLDEIEKALEGATAGAADGGVSADALGAILSWMQDRQGQAFVIATANNAEKLPPELLRKGRFDEIWWVDLPTRNERASIINAALKSHGRDNAKSGRINPWAIAGATESFTGAEIAAIVPDAMFAAFNDGGREVDTNDLMRAARDVVPLAKTAAEKITRLREFWAGRARPATAPATGLEGLTTLTGGRDLDL